MQIPVTAIADSIKRGDILLSEFDGIDHRKFFVVILLLIVCHVAGS